MGKVYKLYGKENFSKCIKILKLPVKTKTSNANLMPECYYKKYSKIDDTDTNTYYIECVPSYDFYNSAICKQNLNPNSMASTIFNNLKSVGDRKREVSKGGSGKKKTQRKKQSKSKKKKQSKSKKKKLKIKN